MARSKLPAGGTMGDPKRLPQELQEGDGREQQLRRAIVGASLVDAASMAIVSLFQTGVIRHLPDPPVKWPHFHSDKVNSFETTCSYGGPDGPIAFAAHAANLVLAATFALTLPEAGRALRQLGGGGRAATRQSSKGRYW